MFIQVIQGRCSRQDELKALAESWRSEVGATPGFLGGTFGFTDDDLFVGVVRFESHEAAMANSERPEQTAWAQKMSALIDGPMEFHDCDDVTVLLDGGSDDAGFVQVIRGRISDVERAKTLMSDTSELRETRPDVIGATLAIEPDGTFTETVAFTDEASARRGEKSEPSEEMRHRLEELLHDASFYDLHHPWFESAR
jgi:hypothetical protein